MQADSIDPRRLLTRQQAADFLGVSVFTLNQYASEGKGPAFAKLGRKAVYRLADLEAYRTAQAEPVAAPLLAATPPASMQTGGLYIMRLPEVLRRIGLSRSSLYAKIKTGDFPAPIKLGPRSNGWNSAIVEAWIAQRLNANVAEVA
ncbi:helix-turn-helix transcriptional regulator [Crenobacter cavernae]|uniref:AlpA family phage regulatory protein n=1 Tax=Crenobacter cavernae TaxID=2290923 RepID=A0A345Y9U0_9NEIS|nr:AlpA family phage regulatory protein [Crenobacter cavernae]AXK40692.1 AlpA family phage regulatory protein [Crenobacter cavernae]